MFEDYYCFRCGLGFKWEQMTATPAGNLFCPDCRNLLDSNKEPPRKCPVDNSEMKKHLVGDVFVIDKCLQCEGIWLDRGELAAIRKKEKDAGWNQGFVLGMLF